LQTKANIRPHLQSTKIHKKGGGILSKEIIVKIKETEQEAANIRKNGTDRAREILRLAEEKSARLCEETERERSAENRQKLELTQKKADELLQKTREDAQKEEEILREASSDRLRDAVRMIIGGLFEKCQ
jgi:vacuolar-type H+-ATPase subunit H